MSNLLTDIPDWVSRSGAGERNFRSAVHTILHAIASDPVLSRKLYMKGGILMALRYESPRFTTDIDFSTPEAFEPSHKDEVERLLSKQLSAASEELPYDLECRLQSIRIKPRQGGTYASIRMTVGYAPRGTAEHARLLRGEAPRTISIDYNFFENVPFAEELSVGEDEAILIYALPTLVAEKYRSLLQQPIRNRYRRQDVYDLKFLLDRRAILADEDCKATVLDALKIKCEDRSVPLTEESMDDDAVRSRAAQEYATLNDELPEPAPEFEASFQQVRDYFRSLPWQKIQEGLESSG